MVLKKMVNGEEVECSPEEEKAMLEYWARGEEEIRLRNEQLAQPKPPEENPMEYIKLLCDYLKINMEDLKNGNIRLTQ